MSWTAEKGIASQEEKKEIKKDCAFQVQDSYGKKKLECFWWESISAKQLTVMQSPSDYLMQTELTAQEDLYAEKTECKK